MLIDERALIAEGIEIPWSFNVVVLYLKDHGVDNYHLRQSKYGLICYTSEDDFIKLNGLRPRNWPYKDSIARHGVIWTTEGRFPKIGEDC